MLTDILTNKKGKRVTGRNLPKFLSLNNFFMIMWWRFVFVPPATTRTVMPAISMVQTNNGFKRILILHYMIRKHLILSWKYIKVKTVLPIVDRTVTMNHTSNGVPVDDSGYLNSGHPSSAQNKHWKSKMKHLITVTLMTVLKSGMSHKVHQSIMRSILTNKKRERKTRFSVISHFFPEDCPL